MFPKRSKISDGWIGDTSHSARKSDHNPNSRGVVCAVDITFDNNPSDGVGVDGDWLSNILVQNEDKRIKYIIWNRRIIKSYASKGKPAWTWMSYSGKNPHDHHVHISVYDVDDSNEWILDKREDHTTTVIGNAYRVKAGDSLSEIAKEFSISVEEIKRKNSLKSDLIKVGQILEV